MYGSRYRRASLLASTTSGGSFSRKSDNSILGEDTFVAAPFCLVVSMLNFLFSVSHRTFGNGLNDRQIDRHKDSHDDTGHYHQDQRLKQGRQLLQPDLSFGVIKRSHFIEHLP